MRSGDIKFELLLLFRFIKWPVITFVSLLFLIELTGRCASIGYQYSAADIDSETGGKIISSSAYSAGKGLTQRHNILYEYEVAGVTYTSRIIDYEHTTTDAHYKVKKYHSGKEVRVLYDSSSPSLSVLEITPLSSSVILLLILVVLSPFIVGVFQVRGW